MNVRRYPKFSSVLYSFNSEEGLLVDVLVKGQLPTVLELEWPQLVVEAEDVRLGEAHGPCEDEFLGVEDVRGCSASLVQVGSHRLIHEVGDVLASLLGSAYDFVVEGPVEPAYEDSIVSQVGQPTRVTLYILITCLLY